MHYYSWHPPKFGSVMAENFPSGTRRPKDIAPDVYSMSTRKNRKLHEALADNQWIRDIALHPTITSHHLQQFVDLWLIVRDVHLSPGVADTIRWKWTSNGEYSASSAYRAQFLGLVKTKLQPLIWKPWAPQKCKFFAWLIIKNRVWTSDRLATRGWPRNEVCPLCRREQESAHHLVVECRYTRRVWGLIAGWVGYPNYFQVTGVLRTLSRSGGFGWETPWTGQLRL